jgi:AcrR family transcriptional regulator
MDEAARRFAASGYDPTSVAEIVGGLGVGKGVFYWYFASKEELLGEILREAQHDLRRCQHAAIREEPDPVRRISSGIRASMAWLSSHRDLFTLFEFAALDERFRPMLRRGQDVAVGDVARHVEDAMRAGSIAGADPLVVAHAILGVTNQLARTFVLHRGDQWEQVADAAVAFCLTGLFGGLGGAQPAVAFGGPALLSAAPGG